MPSRSSAGRSGQSRVAPAMVVERVVAALGVALRLGLGDGRLAEQVDGARRRRPSTGRAASPSAACGLSPTMKRCAMCLTPAAAAAPSAVRPARELPIRIATATGGGGVSTSPRKPVRWRARSSSERHAGTTSTKRNSAALSSASCEASSIAFSSAALSGLRVPGGSAAGEPLGRPSCSSRSSVASSMRANATAPRGQRRGTRRAVASAFDICSVWAMAELQELADALARAARRARGDRGPPLPRARLLGPRRGARPRAAGVDPHARGARRPRRLARRARAADGDRRPSALPPPPQLGMGPRVAVPVRGDGCSATCGWSTTARGRTSSPRPRETAAAAAPRARAAPRRRAQRPRARRRAAGAATRPRAAAAGGCASAACAGRCTCSPATTWRPCAARAAGIVARRARRAASPAATPELDALGRRSA